jgi:predicted membrane-bound mannosyltransferase
VSYKLEALVLHAAMKFPLMSLVVIMVVPLVILRGIGVTHIAKAVAV